MNFQEIQSKYRDLRLMTDVTQRRPVENEVRKALAPIKEEARSDLGDLKEILNWEKSVRILSVPDSYLLNQIEFDEIEEEFECVSKLPSPGWQINVGDRGKFAKRFDEERSKEVYTLYFPVVIEPESQIGRELERKIRQGFHPSEGDYPEPKQIIKKHTLVDTEFVKYFIEV